MVRIRNSQKRNVHLQFNIATVHKLQFVYCILCQIFCSFQSKFSNFSKFSIPSSHIPYYWIQNMYKYNSNERRYSPSNTWTLIFAGPVFDGIHSYVPESAGLVFSINNELIVASDFSVLTRLNLPCIAVTTDTSTSDTSLFLCNDCGWCRASSTLDT